MKFTLAQKIYISGRIKAEVAKVLRLTYDKPLVDRERAIMTAVAEAIKNLPAKENNV